MIKKERAIIFTGESVRGILSGSKTQTRRVIKWRKDPENGSWIKSIHADGGGNWVAWSSDEPGLADFTKKAYPNGEGFRCPYGKPRDLLYVKETWAPIEGLILYRADAHKPFETDGPWKSSRFMPRKFSRITLEITDIRIQRLQEITEADARDEGVDARVAGQDEYGRIMTYRTGFVYLWEKINGKKFPWIMNPWVFVISFRRVQ